MTRIYLNEERNRDALNPIELDIIRSTSRLFTLSSGNKKFKPFQIAKSPAFDSIWLWINDPIFLNYKRTNPLFSVLHIPY